MNQKHILGSGMWEEDVLFHSACLEVAMSSYNWAMYGFGLPLVIKLHL